MQFRKSFGLLAVFFGILIGAWPALAAPGQVGSWEEAIPVRTTVSGYSVPDALVGVGVDSQGAVWVVSTYGEIRKYDKDGALLWNASLNASIPDEVLKANDVGLLNYVLSDVAVDGSDAVYVLGYHKKNVADDHVNQIFLRKLNADGSKAWKVVVADFTDGQYLYGLTPSARAHVKVWQAPDSREYVLVSGGMDQTLGYFCYDLDGHLVWHRDDGLATGAFAVAGDKLFRPKVVETSSGRYAYAPTLQVCGMDTTSGNTAPLACTEVSLPAPAGAPSYLSQGGDVAVFSNAKEQTIYFTSFVTDASSSLQGYFAFFSAYYDSAQKKYVGEASFYFPRGILPTLGYPDDKAQALAVTPDNHVWLAGSYATPFALPVRYATLSSYRWFVGLLGASGQIYAQYDYGHPLGEDGQIYNPASYLFDVAVDVDGKPILVGSDKVVDKNGTRFYLLVKTNGRELPPYHYIKPLAQWSIHDPVSPATGNFAMQAVDLRYPTGGIPLVLKRFYSARFAAQAGRFGYGWSSLLDMHLSPSASGYTLFWADGHGVDFVYEKSMVNDDGLKVSTFTAVGVAPGYTLTSYSDGTTLYFDVYVAKLDRTIRLAQEEEGSFYPTLFFRGKDPAAKGARPLVVDYLTNPQAAIRLEDQASGRGVTLLLDPNTGRIIQAQGDAGEVLKYTYDEDGNLTEVEKPDGTKVSYAYDEGHHLTQISQDGTVLLENTYDEEGRVVRQKDAAGQETTFAYDDASRKTTVTSPDGRQTFYYYNEQYNLTKVEDEAGHARSYAYDLLGRITAMTMPDGAVTHLEYDDAGRLVAMEDSQGRTFRYTYDAEGRFVSATAPDGTQVSYTYTNGRLSSWTVPAGGTYTLAIDDQGQVQAITDPLGQSVTLAYDEAGLLRAVTRRDGVEVSYQRDAAGRVMQKTFDNGAETITFTYDSLGRLTSAKNALGTVGYAFNSRGYKSQETDAFGNTVAYGYTNARLSSVQVKDFQITTERNAAGLPTSVSTSFGQELTYAYDTEGRLLSVTLSDSGSTLAQVAYTYNQAGLVSQIALKDASGQAFRTMTLSYAPGGRITAVADDGAPEPRAPATWQGTFDQADRLTTATYDPCGRLTQSSQDAYTYDVEGNLTQVSHDGHTASLSYDALGRVVEITEDGVSKRLVYAGAAPVMETDGSGHPTAYYVFGPGVSLVLGGDGALRYVLLSDWRSNVVAVLDNKGEVAAQRLYAPYGLVLGEEGTWPVPFGFLGARGLYSLQSGLVLTRARAYDPVQGRFLTPDPKRPSPSLPMALNRYAYSYDDPVNHTDPSGLSPFAQDTCCVYGMGVMYPIGLNIFNPVSWTSDWHSLRNNTVTANDVVPVYAERDVENGGGNPRLAPVFTDERGILTSPICTREANALSLQPALETGPGTGYLSDLRFDPRPIIVVIFTR